MIERFPLQGCDGLHALVELAGAFPSQKLFAHSVYTDSWGVEFKVRDFRFLPISEVCRNRLTPMEFNL